MKHLAENIYIEDKKPVITVLLVLYLLTLLAVFVTVFIISLLFTGL